MCPVYQVVVNFSALGVAMYLPNSNKHNAYCTELLNFYVSGVSLYSNMIIKQKKTQAIYT